MIDLVGYVLEPLAQYSFMRAGLVAAVIVGTVCAVVSCLLIVRRQALLGDAISHAVLLGVVLGYLVAEDAGILWGAMVIAVLCGVTIAFIERRSRLRADAAMGVVFTTFFALALAIISVARPRGIDLFHILFGNVLGVTTGDLVLTAVSGGLVLAVIGTFFRVFHLWTLDPEFAQAIGIPVGVVEYAFTALLAAAVVASLQTVGVILVIAMLVIPGATATLLTNRLVTMMLAAVAIGIAAGSGGVYASFYLDIASGPAIVLTASALFTAAFLLAPKHGVISLAVERRRAATRALDEDLLKQLVRVTGPLPSPRELAEKIEADERSVQAALRRLTRRRLLDSRARRLTASGEEEAVRLVRSHRLWEQYLHDAEGVPLEAVHSLADDLEHGTDDVTLRDLDRILDAPLVDPHGHPIPRTGADIRTRSGRSLSTYEVVGRVIVTTVADDREEILDQIVDLGIVPGRPVDVLDITGDVVRVVVNGDEHELAREIAERVFVVPIAE